MKELNNTEIDQKKKIYLFALLTLGKESESNLDLI